MAEEIIVEIKEIQEKVEECKGLKEEIGLALKNYLNMHVLPGECDILKRMYLSSI